MSKRNGKSPRPVKLQKHRVVKFCPDDFNLAELCENNWGHGDTKLTCKIRLARLDDSYLN